LGRADALYVSGDALLNALLTSQQFNLNTLAASEKLPSAGLDGISKGLRELGYEEGRDFAIESPPPGAP
jgi:hypothetical protein